MKNRRWLSHVKARDLLKPKRKWFSFSVVVSLVALALSLWTFYFTYFHIEHTLQLSVVRAGGDDSELPVTFDTDILLLNPGNRSATLLSLEVTFGEATGGTWTYDPRLRKGPYVLKPGDALPVNVSWMLTKDMFENVADWSGAELERTAKGVMSLQLSAVSSDGKEIRRKIQIGTFEYYEPSDELRFKASQSDGSKFVDLLQPVKPNLSVEAKPNGMPACPPSGCS
nr:hypothetical protein [uncultured Albidiferax sp.]